MLTATQKNRTVFEISISQMDSLYDVLQADLLAEIKRMKALGISNEEIFSRISDSLNNGMSMFGKFKGAVEKELDIVVGETAQVESHEVLKQVEGKFKWELDPTAQEHCPDCLRNSGAEPKTFGDWEALGLPGMGNTQCGSYCKCTLTVEV